MGAAKRVVRVSPARCFLIYIGIVFEQHGNVAEMLRESRLYGIMQGGVAETVTGVDVSAVVEKNLPCSAAR